MKSLLRILGFGIVEETRDELRRITKLLEEMTRRYMAAQHQVDQLTDRQTRAARATDGGGLVERKTCLHAAVSDGFCARCGEAVACPHSRWTFREHNGHCPDCGELMIDTEDIRAASQHYHDSTTR